MEDQTKTERVLFMKRFKLLSTLLLLVCLTLSLAACSSASYSGEMTNSASKPEAGGASADFAPAPSSAPMDPGGILDGNYSTSAGSGSYYENTKVILTAGLSLQSTDFDGAVAALDALVNAQKGYYESSEYSYGGYYGSSARWGHFTVRVPRENYQAFLSAVGDVAHVTRRNTGTQDVGEAYYDAELHLATLKTKHERLLALLDKAELMEDIISLESALSEVEYQIQQYTSTLKRYDGLIDFATIRLDLEEVVRVTENPTEADPLHVRLGAALSKGWNDFCDSMADFAIWVAYNLVGVVIFLAILAIAILVLVRVLRGRRRRRGQAQPIPQPASSSSRSGDESKQ